MDGRTDWQAGGLPLFTLESTRRRLCVATLLICRQPDTSNSLRIFCLFHILSFIISIFSVFRPSLVAGALFLSTCSCPASGIDLCFCRVPAQEASKISHFCPNEVRTHCQFCCCSGLGSHLYAWPPCSTYRVPVFNNLQCNKFCLTSQFFSEVDLPALQID